MASVRRAVQKLRDLLNETSISRATVVVPNLGNLGNTVLPAVLEEFGMHALAREHLQALDDCTLTLCSENTFSRGHSNSQAYLVLFSLPAFIKQVENLQAWNTLIVVTSEDNARNWRDQNEVEAL